MTNDIFMQIQDEMDSFSKGQKRIAQYILTAYDKAAFMTASELGEKVNVSESTVVRFAARVGYEGYPEMQRALQEIIRNKLTTVQRIEVTNQRLGQQDIPSTVMHTDAENIRATLAELDRDSFNATVDAILNARRIYISGVRSSYTLAGFLGLYFHMMFENVTVIHTNSSSEVLEQLLTIGKEDVMLGISFPRYSRRTVRTMRYARDHGAVTLALTDSPQSPLVEIADHVLLAKSDIASFVDSLVAPLSLVNALIVAVSQKKGGELEDTLEKLEQIWEQYEVYEKTGQSEDVPCNSTLS